VDEKEKKKGKAKELQLAPRNFSLAREEGMKGKTQELSTCNLGSETTRPKGGREGT